MLKERAVMDPHQRDERFPQFLPSSELTAVWYAPWIRPTFSVGGIHHG